MSVLRDGILLKFTANIYLTTEAVPFLLPHSQSLQRCDGEILTINSSRATSIYIFAKHELSILFAL